MKYTRTYLGLLIFGVVYLITENVGAQFKLSKSVFGNGGTVLTDSSNQIKGTVGQQLIGISGNSSTINKAGFWYQTLDIVTGVEQITGTLPDEFRLKQNYPNPFNPQTTIEFAIPKPTSVKLKIFDLLGREIVTLVDKKLQPGEYKLNFDGKGVPSGVYFYRLQSEGFVSTKKLMLLK